MQQLNYKAMIVKYILNVLSFAIVYSAVALALMAAGLEGFLVSAIAAAAAVFSLMALMKKVGPWVDRRMGGK